MSTSEHSQQSAYSGSVIVVDDHVGLRQMLSRALKMVGFDVFEARTEIELQHHLARCQPDALLIDLQRCEADGLVLVERLRGRPSLRDMPILLLAGSDEDEFGQQALAAGADWFGVRPLGIIDLRNRVAQLIRDRPPKQAVTTLASRRRC